MVSVADTGALLTRTDVEDTPEYPALSVAVSSKPYVPVAGATKLSVCAVTSLLPSSTNYARTAGSSGRCAGKKRSGQSVERWHENHADVVGAINILSCGPRFLPEAANCYALQPAVVR
jgi:hypothetical protein